jgi:hypothetical protein
VVSIGGDSVVWWSGHYSWHAGWGVLRAFSSFEMWLGVSP